MEVNQGREACSMYSGDTNPMCWWREEVAEGEVGIYTRETSRKSAEEETLRRNFGDDARLKELGEWIAMFIRLKQSITNPVMQQGDPRGAGVRSYKYIPTHKNKLQRLKTFH